jgi:tetratricopeptide (TPR) repeat protein
MSMRSVVRGWFGIGDRSKAIEQQRELLDYCIRIHGPDSPQDVKARWELRQYEARLHRHSLQPVTEEKSKIDESDLRKRRLAGILTLEKDYARLLEVHGSMHPDSIGARIRLANMLASAGHTIEALIHLQALQAATMELFGPRDDHTLKVQSLLVWVYVKLGRYNDAVRAQQAVVIFLRERDGDTAESTVEAENDLERRLFYSSLRDELAEYRKDLLQRRIKLFGENHVNTVMVPIQHEADNEGDANKNMLNAIRVMRETYGSKSRWTAEAIAALARATVQEGRANEALAMYAECAPNMLDDTWVNYECATFQLWTGDQEGYQKTRRNILNYWEGNTHTQKSNAEMFDRALSLSCVADLDDEQQKNAVRKILKHVKTIRTGLSMEAEERHSIGLQKQIHGTVLYRLGEYEEALASFQEAMRTMESRLKAPSGMDYLLSPQLVNFFMAMAHHRIGNPTEAKRLLDLGESLLKGSPPSEENPVVKYFTGGEALALWIIHREAKELINKD